MNKEDNSKERFKQALISTVKVISEDYKIEKEKSSNTVKGELIKSLFITSTMGVSYKLKLSKNI